MFFYVYSPLFPTVISMIDIQDIFINRKPNLRLYEHLMAFQHVPCHSNFSIHDSFSLNVTFSASDASWTRYLSIYLSTYVSFCLSVFLPKLEWSKSRLIKVWYTLFLIKKMLLYLNMSAVTFWYNTDSRMNKNINHRMQQTNNIEKNIDKCECICECETCIDVFVPVLYITLCSLSVFFLVSKHEWQVTSITATLNIQHIMEYLSLRCDIWKLLRD